MANTSTTKQARVTKAEVDLKKALWLAEMALKAWEANRPVADRTSPLWDKVNLTAPAAARLADAIDGALDDLRKVVL